MTNTIHRYLSAVVALLSTTVLLMGQPASDKAPNTGTPYHTIHTHLYYLQPGSFAPDKSAMALHPDYGKDSIDRQRVAIRLKQVLDGRGLFVHMGELPQYKDYIDSSTLRATYTLFAEELPEIYLERVGDQWYYAPQSLEQLGALHDATYPFGTDALINAFGPWSQRRIFGLAIWQYIGLGITLLISALLYLLLRLLITPFIRRVLTRWLVDKGAVQLHLIHRITAVLTLMVVLQCALWLIPSLLLPIKTALVLDRLLRLMQAVAIAMFLVRLVDFFMFYLTQIVERTTNRMDDQAVPLIRNLLKGFIWIGAMFHVLTLFDIDITALVAGVSIGSLAIALAAQDAIKHLIGSVVIFVDRPFHVGDYVIGDGFEGEIVEVGFRTTRIKTLDTSIIAVPNGNITNMSIRNLGVRALRLFNTTITLTYDSSPDQIKAFIEALKQVIMDHPLLREEGHHVVLRDLSESSIDVLFRAYLDVPTYAEELKLKEDLMFKIMELAERHGLSFAFPSQSVYIEHTSDSADEIKKEG